MKLKNQILTVLLCVCLCLGMSACTQNGNTPDETTETGIPFSETGIVSHGCVEEADFPTDAAFSSWFALAYNREQLTNALLYAKDGTDGLWHCWLYLGSYTEGDTLELGAVSAQGTVLLRHTANDEASLQASCVFYFTVDREAEPEFELYQNGDYAGMLVTLGDKAIKK